MWTDEPQLMKMNKNAAPKYYGSNHCWVPTWIITEAWAPGAPYGLCTVHEQWCTYEKSQHYTVRLSTNTEQSAVMRCIRSTVALSMNEKLSGQPWHYRGSAQFPQCTFSACSAISAQPGYESYKANYWGIFFALCNVWWQ